MLQGLPISPGIAKGRVYSVDRRRVTVPRFRLAPEHRGEERVRFDQAIEQSERQLVELQSRSEDQLGLGPVFGLLKAHAMILRDSAFYDAAIQRIQEDGQNAEWAVRTTIREVKRLFDRVEHAYFRERRSDVDVVGDRVLRNLLHIPPDPLANLPAGAVIAAWDLTPADTLALGRASVAAFVIEGGGRTSHTAILARALGVPCVLGLSGLLDAVHPDQPVMVDGTTGVVVLDPDPSDISRFEGVAQRRHKEEQSLLADRELPAETQDGVRVQLLGNMEVQQEAETLVRVGAEGVGLYRTEFLHIDDVDHDDASAQANAYERVLERMEGRPVTIRTLDLGGEKDPAFSVGLDYDAEPHRRTSPLGLRSIRISLREPSSFRLQLEAILQASARGPVRLLFPFVTDVAELLEAHALLARAREDLRARQVEFDPDMPVGVMVETPASVVCLDHLSRHCDFFAVGTNDLISLLLAADRSDEAVAHMYRPAHPAVLRTLQSIRRGTDLPVSVCGELAADPFMAPVLIGLGYEALSMAAASIPVVKRVVRRLQAEECRELAAELLTLETADQVEQRIHSRLKSWVPDLFGAAG